MVHEAETAKDRPTLQLAEGGLLKAGSRLETDRDLGTASGGRLVVRREVEDLALLGRGIEALCGARTQGQRACGVRAVGGDVDLGLHWLAVCGMCVCWCIPREGKE